MRIRFQFQLDEKLIFYDSWPVKVGNVAYAFSEHEGKSIISATLINQSVEFAPGIELENKKLKNITLQHGVLLPTILERLETLQCSLGLILPREINTTEYDVFFEAENAAEEIQIPMKSWRTERRELATKVPFDIAAKGLLSEPWPEGERKAAQFYRRGRQALKERFYVDAFVNYYFFLERLYAAGQFKTSAVVNCFSNEKALVDAFTRPGGDTRSDALARGVPLDKDASVFFEWVVTRRGFFQHQSQTDPNRRLHSTQREYLADAYVMAELSMSVYSERNAGRIFSDSLNKRYVEAAAATGATMKVVIDIYGDDPARQPIRQKFSVEAPGTKPTASMASGVLTSAMKTANDRLIAVRQITATVDKTNELIFSYTCTASG